MTYDRFNILFILHFIKSCDLIFTVDKTEVVICLVVDFLKDSINKAQKCIVMFF